MKRFAFSILVAVSGCAPINQFITPHQPVVAMQELGAPDYELLGQITGVACRDKDELKNLIAQSRGTNKDFEENLAQETVVYYEAKFNALESVPDALAGWAKHNGCDGDAVLDDPPGPLSTLSYKGCDAEVRLVRIDGLVHAWARTEVDATAEAWRFFSAHKLGESAKR